jgi:uncharacterized surface protein with fasciclin (FAS1) repeats
MRFNPFISASLLAVANAQDLNATLTGNPNLSELTALLISQPSLFSSLAGASNITVLAPSNDAIGALLNSSAGASFANNTDAITALLTYHVLNGTYLASAVPENETFIPTELTNPSFANVTGGQRLGAARSGANVTFFSGLLQNSSVSQANLNFTGGVVHVIDRILTLPENASSTLIAAGLSSLAGALTNASLVDAVDGLKDVTIFAPSNAAFQRIGSALPNLTTQDLTSILTYHVVNGTSPLYSTDLSNGTKVATLQGTELTITITEAGAVFVNGAEVTVPNVLIAGGVVHVIDNVLNPSSTATANGTATSGSPAFSGASSASNAPFTSGVPAPSSSIASALSSSSSKAGAGQAMATGAVGAMALFGAGAAFINM